MSGAPLALLLTWAAACWVQSVAVTIASPAVDIPLAGNAAGMKQLVVACNGFPGAPAIVGVQQRTPGPAAVSGLRKLFLRSHLRLDHQRAKHQLGGKSVLQPPPAALSSLAQLHPRAEAPGSHSLQARKLRTHTGAHTGAARLSGPLPLADKGPDSDLVVWKRNLAYGECEEYHVDLAKRRFFFATSNGAVTCDFKPAQLADDAGMAQQFLAVFTQPEASSSSCSIRSAAFDKPEVKKSGFNKPAQLATVDAFTQASASHGDEDEEELRRRDARRGLQPLPPLPAEAVIRIEDKLDDAAISSEVLASQTFGWGHTYALEPGSFHLILEDMRGSHMPDHMDAFFEEGCTYMAVRLGKVGDSAYPERLIFRRVENARPL